MSSPDFLSHRMLRRRAAKTTDDRGRFWGRAEQLCTNSAYIAWGEFMDTDDLFVTVRTTRGTSQIGVFRTLAIDADILASV